MSTDAIVILNHLRCIREDDAVGHSEPYIWPVLLRIDDNTLATPLLIGVTRPLLENARVVIKSDMRAGQTADIPASVGMLRTRFEDGLDVRRLILAVALWEEDETPEEAVRAGFQAFSSELRAAIADNLFALSTANEAEEKTLIETIKTRVKDQVASAIENGLTGWQKARVVIGTLNLDDFNGSDFKNFHDVVATPVGLVFKVGSSDHYEIEGELQVRPVRIEQCQVEVDRVKAAQVAVDAVEREIKQVQSELQRASPAQKPFLISEIRRLRQEELADAMAVLEAARRALQFCHDRIATFGHSGSVLTTGNGMQVAEMEIQGFKTKTFFNDGGNIQVTIASDGKSTIVAIPKLAISLRNQMGDDEYKCLKKCENIADLEKRLNCILSCPVTKLYNVFIFEGMLTSRIMA